MQKEKPPEPFHQHWSSSCPSCPLPHPGSSSCVMPCLKDRNHQWELTSINGDFATWKRAARVVGVVVGVHTEGCADSAGEKGYSWSKVTLKCRFRVDYICATCKYTCNTHEAGICC
ncbi:hypothetical protein L208DRAFT_913680 [Tricholoma matsutake]|nr:hypothetical protein L208DRAFT_913680 [Tricholoma matsutake 945]